MRRLYLTAMASLTSLWLVAQEKKTDIVINLKMDDGSSFWGSSVMWVIGAAVFINILVVVILSRRRQIK